MPFSYQQLPQPDFNSMPADAGQLPASRGNAMQNKQGLLNGLMDFDQKLKQARSLNEPSDASRRMLQRMQMMHVPGDPFGTGYMHRMGVI